MQNGSSNPVVAVTIAVASIMTESGILDAVAAEVRGTVTQIANPIAGLVLLRNFFLHAQNIHNALNCGVRNKWGENLDK